MPTLNFQERPKYEAIEVIMRDGKKFAVQEITFATYSEVMAEDRKGDDVWVRLIEDLGRVLGVKSADLAGYDIREIMELNSYVHENLRKQSAAADPTPAEVKK